jgi:cell wall-associated NlpC family hydrolase
MIPYFANPIQIAELAAIARAWLGTPFHHHAKLRGVGVACVHLLAEVLRESGVLGSYKFPSYSMGEPVTDRSLVTDWLSVRPEFVRLSEDEDRRPGDILCIRWSKVPHHCGLVLSRKSFIHAIPRAGAIESDLRDPTYRRRIQAAFRPVEP